MARVWGEENASYGTVALLTSGALGAARVWRLVPTLSPHGELDGESRSGHPAAQYDLGAADRRWGEVRVWSEGAHTEDDGTAEAPSNTTLHISFEIENALDDAPLEVDLTRTRLVSVDIDEREVEAIPVARVDGDASVRPHTVRRVELEFPLPTGVGPRDLRAFDVHWVLQGPGDWQYEQHTGFVRHYRRRHHYWGYWGPSPWFYGHSYAWSWGYRWRP